MWLPSLTPEGKYFGRSLLTTFLWIEDNRSDGGTAIWPACDTCHYSVWRTAMRKNHALKARNRITELESNVFYLFYCPSPTKKQEGNPSMIPLLHYQMLRGGLEQPVLLNFISLHSFPMKALQATGATPFSKLFQELQIM